MMAGVTEQIVGRRRHATRREIIGRSDDPVRECPCPTHHQSRVPGFAGADHGIETFVDHIHQPVGEVEVKLDLGIGTHEGHDCGHHQHAD
ncbi:hypothetical protein D3C87_1304740 [compost metagenome]